MIFEVGIGGFIVMMIGFGFFNRPIATEFLSVLCLAYFVPSRRAFVRGTDSKLRYGVRLAFDVAALVLGFAALVGPEPMRVHCAMSAIAAAMFATKIIGQGT